MPDDDTKTKANRIIDAFEKKGLTSHWSKMDTDSARQTIMQAICDDPTFGDLALTDGYSPFDDWPNDYQEQFWMAWPKIRRQDKLCAMKSLDKIRKIGKVSFKVILAAVEVYAHETRNKERRYILLPSTWLNGHHWEDEYMPNGHANGHGEVNNGFLGRLMEP